MIPCDSQSIRVIKAQNYDNGPEVVNHVKELAGDPTLYGWGSWLILRKSDDVIIGDAGFKGKPNSKKEVEIGYGLLESVCGLGYATEAVRGLLDWAFNTTAVDKVVAETDVNNISSIRVLEKVGMEKRKSKEDLIYWKLSKR